MNESYLYSLLGGVLIGLSAAVMLLLNGRVAGISGILAGIFERRDSEVATKAVFVVGLLMGPLIYLALFGIWPVVRVSPSLGVMMLAGLAVGFGTRLGSGCTSGHGVCGLARLSARSLAAVATFLAVGIATVFVMNHLVAS